MKKLTISEAYETVKGSGYFGLRGLSGVNGNKKYREGQILKCSYNDWDGRGIEYSSKLDQLNGTSAICAHNYMDEEEFNEAYNKAMNYSDCGKVILISGVKQEYGYDNDEVILSNYGRGAKYLGEVIL